jgi:ABC-2 type transport system permease protein
VLINPVIAGLTLRQSLARRRWIVVMALAALPVVMATLIRIYSNLDEDPRSTVVSILSGLSLTVVVPIIALTPSSAGFGAEIDDGTVVNLLTKPIPRSVIAVTKLAVTALIAVGLNGASTLISGVITMHGLDATHLVVGFTMGAALGGFLYTAIFLALGLITRRGMLVGLIYLVVWEGVLSRLFAGTRNLSVRQYMLSVCDAIARVDPAIFTAQLPHEKAYYMSVAVAALALAFCIHRLRTFEVGQTG